MTTSRTLDFHDWLVALRRTFHQVPELYFQEKKTAAIICRTLDEMGVPYRTGVAGTGVVARLKAKREGPLVAFRADMDALPLEEACEVSHRSRHPGMMHACGHDGHMTIALGIIRWLKEQHWPEEGSGEVLFFFQPGEEEGAGARVMLESGEFDGEPVRAIFAGHLDPELPVGHVEVVFGAAHAATNSLIFRIRGKGGHGASPHLCVDPIVAGAHLVTQLQVFVSRNLSPLDSAVLTIGEFHAGTATNIIPEEAILTGTLRTLSPQVRKQAIERIEAMAHGLEKTFDVRVEFVSQEGYPMQVNDDRLVEFVKACAGDLLGPGAVHVGLPKLGAEDFSYFCQKWPGAMVKLGCHDPEKGFRYGLHSPHFDPDEGVLSVGVRLFGTALTRYLKSIHQ